MPDDLLSVPKGATDPLWYFLADYLCPKHIGTTARKGWIEGFVTALEAARGIGVDGDVSSALRESVTLEMAAPA